MKLSTNQKGSSHLILILAVFVIAGVSYAAWRVGHTSKTVSSANTQNVPATTGKITTKADVLKASKALDQEKIDKNINPNQLDEELNASL